jgi:hypothetical protein
MKEFKDPTDEEGDMISRSRTEKQKKPTEREWSCVGSRQN